MLGKKTIASQNGKKMLGKINKNPRPTEKA